MSSLHRGGLAGAQAFVVATAFALLLAGTNAINPLLPLYRESLGLEALLLSLTFVCYVSVLVVVLLILANPRYSRHSAVLLLAALSVAIIGDALIATAQPWSILLGRAVAGVAVGLGTGSAAALVVAAIGDGGRALAATGNLAGAVVGTALAQLVVSVAPATAPHTVMWGHATILGVVLIAVWIVLVSRRRDNQEAFLPTAAPGLRKRLRLRKGAPRLFLVGSVGWITVSAAIVFGATIFAELGMPMARTFGPTMMLAASAAAQLASPRLARIFPGWSGLVSIALGCAVVVISAMIRFEVPALIGFIGVGIGVGISYRTALVVLTRGVDPADQGALSALYAAVTYAAAALANLAVGALGASVGVVTAALAALVFVGTIALLVSRRAPRLRDTVVDERGAQ